MEITFLGTGTSMGVPMIGCHCAVCHSEDSRDRRTRTSAVVRVDDRNLLIDTSPELRLQAVAVGLERVDAVLYTHPHADHTAGFDELRRFNQLQQREIDIFGDLITISQLRRQYHYAFEDPFPFFGGKPAVRLHEFRGPFEAAGIPIVPLPVKHGRWTVHGFRIGGLVYITDAKEIPATTLDLMGDAEVLVINALRVEPHPVHLSLPEALALIKELRPRRSLIVHVSHHLGHEETSQRLPTGVELAYDGLTVSVGPIELALPSNRLERSTRGDG